MKEEIPIELYKKENGEFVKFVRYEEINKKEAMYDSLAVDYRLAQEEIEDYSNKWCELAKAKTKSDNIINELEKILEEERKKDRPRDDYNYGVGNTLDYIWYKLQELKGSDKGDI